LASAQDAACFCLYILVFCCFVDFTLEIPASQALLLLLQVWHLDEKMLAPAVLTHCDCLAMHQLVQLINGQVHQPITIWAATGVFPPAALKRGRLA
jgi:hypothetical protein